MPDKDCDVLVIGGGPGGTAAATALARHGHRTILLEKERFPRFHIGESLLPYNHELFDGLGLAPHLDAAGFLVKHGAQFHAGNGRHSTQFVFRIGRFTRHPLAFQVERATFDHLLLQHAHRCGVDTREAWTVTRTSPEPSHHTIEATDPQARPQRLTARFVIDASGRSNLTGNLDGLRETHPRQRKVALYSHFHDVRLDPGPSGGDTVIIRLSYGWFWFIPLSREKVSVGLVLDSEAYSAARLSPAELFQDTVRRTPAAAARLARATPAMPIQVTSDFSYFNRRFVSHRLARVGDAAGFLDPIFSAGVYLAMHSGVEVANLLHTALQRGTDATADLARYERRFRKAMHRYWHLVELFYTQPFMELFFSPRERFHLASAVNAILAGELRGGWKLQWRMTLFFLLVRLQRHYPVVPRAHLDA